MSEPRGWHDGNGPGGLLPNGVSNRWAILAAMVVFCGLSLAPVVPAQDVSLLELRAGPYLRFTEEGTVTIEWECDTPGRSMLKYGVGTPDIPIEVSSSGTTHQVQLTGLTPHTRYSFHIRSEREGRESVTATHGFDSTVETGIEPLPAPLPPSPYPQDGLSLEYSRAAEHVLRQAESHAGYGLVLGCGEGRLVYEIAVRSDLKVIGIEIDAAKAAAARGFLAEAGLYGTRASILEGSLESLGLPGYFANLIVCDWPASRGRIPSEPDEVFRVLRPFGGVAYLGWPSLTNGSRLERWQSDSNLPEANVVENDGVWLHTRRGDLAGSGEWTQMYANPGNTASSGDELVRYPTQLQWFGGPGPRRMIDRHHRTVPPLSKNGRLFIPGDNRIVAVDAYNGARLWDVGIPGSRRVGALKDAGNMALAEDILYVAYGNKCGGLDVKSGEPTSTFTVPSVIDAQLEWGYIAVQGDLLFGSAQRTGASRTELSRASVAEQYGDLKPMVTSAGLFALDRRTGDVRWTYSSGTVCNSAIAVGGGRVFFVESRNPKYPRGANGRVLLPELLASNTHVVALDAESGEVAWDQPSDLTNCEHILYASYADEVLVLTGSKNKDKHARYYLYALNGVDGSERWRGEHNHTKEGVGGDHGEQVHHPVIASGIVFTEPVAYDLQIGERVNPKGEPGEWSMTARSGCGTMSGSARCLFYRDANPNIFDPEVGNRRKITSVSRPGCWINIIPAGGLVLIPEASSGCTCNFAVQTSMAFIPGPRSLE